jgi:hypothetical protein
VKSSVGIVASFLVIFLLLLPSTWNGTPRDDTEDEGQVPTTWDQWFLNYRYSVAHGCRAVRSSTQLTLLDSDMGMVNLRNYVRPYEIWRRWSSFSVITSMKIQYEKQSLLNVRNRFLGLFEDPYRVCNERRENNSAIRVLNWRGNVFKINEFCKINNTICSGKMKNQQLTRSAIQIAIDLVS